MVGPLLIDICVGGRHECESIFVQIKQDLSPLGNIALPCRLASTAAAKIGLQCNLGAVLPAKIGLCCSPRIAALPKSPFRVGRPCQKRASVAAKCRFRPSCEDRPGGRKWPQRSYLGFRAVRADGPPAGGYTGGPFWRRRVTPRAENGNPLQRKGDFGSGKGRTAYTEARFWRRRGALPTRKPVFGRGRGIPKLATN